MESPDITALLLSLLPGLGTVLLAIVSGAGGSALLEIYWKPKRDRQRAAAIFLAEILLNTDLLLLQAHARVKSPRKIPSDFEMSLIGWGAAVEVLRELSPDLLKSLVRLYARYHHLNQRVRDYASAFSELQSLPPDASRVPILKQHLNAVIDVFNTGVDKSIDDGKLVLPQLLGLAKIKKSKEAKAKVRDYAKDVESFLAEREQRLESLEAMDKNTGPDQGPHQL